MSDHVPPEVVAFQELEQLVRSLGDELGAFRQRALAAEARLKDLDRGAAPDAPPGAGFTARLDRLEEENARLREQVQLATARTRQVLNRVRFLRQQAARAAEVADR